MKHYGWSAFGMDTASEFCISIKGLHYIFTSWTIDHCVNASQRLEALYTPLDHQPVNTNINTIEHDPSSLHL